MKIDLEQWQYIEEVKAGIRKKADKQKITDFEFSCLGMIIGNLETICDSETDKKEILDCLENTCQERIRLYGDTRMTVILGYIDEIRKAV